MLLSSLDMYVHQIPSWLILAEIEGGRHLLDIIGDFSWTKGATSRGHFW